MNKTISMSIRVSEEELDKLKQAARLEAYAIEWRVVGINEIEGLEPISEEDADDIIKEFEGDEYDLVDGYVLCDFSGEV